MGLNDLPYKPIPAGKPDNLLAKLTNMETNELFERARKTGGLIAASRKKNEISQQLLAETLGKSRSWVTRLERGSYVNNDGETFPTRVAPEDLAKAAFTVGADVGEVLMTAYNDSNIVAKFRRQVTLDVSDLSDAEVRLVVNLISSIREQFHEQEKPNENQTRKPNIDS